MLGTEICLCIVGNKTRPREGPARVGGGSRGSEAKLLVIIFLLRVL